jgi:poly(3-hydroxybutyrate) depolymerase
MAYRMACDAPSLFAGVAAVEAVPAAACPAAQIHVPLLTVASAADPLLRIGPGGPASVIDGHPQPAVVDVVAQWRRREGCSPAMRTTVIGALTNTVWPDCTAKGQVGLSLYQAGRHVWPAGGPGTPSAQAEILDFFRTVAPGAFRATP